MADTGVAFDASAQHPRQGQALSSCEQLVELVEAEVGQIMLLSLSATV